MATVKQWFVTGIGTGIGKTLVSTILTECLHADYWKPVQSGDLACSDTQVLESLVSQPVNVHKEQYAFKTPVSPHQAAAMEDTSIMLNSFCLPHTANHLIVEGAGGLFVPLNDTAYMIDLIVKLNLPVVLVIQDYLGCINHSLLSLEALYNRKIELAAVVFNGDFNPYTKELLRSKIAPAVHIIELPWLSDITKEEIKKLAEGLLISEGGK